MNPELLTPEEFDAHLNARTLRLSFVGMASCGKSYRAKMLESEKDFLWYQVDDDIQKVLGIEGQEAMSEWLGHPTSSTYQERERRYLELENEFTENVAMSLSGKNLIFDTTGSVIHVNSSTLDLLRDNTLVVHLDVGDESLDKLVELFFEKPKPIAWCGNFTRLTEESEESALRRSYPILLRERLKRYRDLAHINVMSRELYDKSGDETLAIIKSKL